MNISQKNIYINIPFVHTLLLMVSFLYFLSFIFFRLWHKTNKVVSYIYIYGMVMMGDAGNTIDNGNTHARPDPRLEENNLARQVA